MRASVCACATSGWQVDTYASVAEFLEDRFGTVCRRYAALCYVCIQMVRTASILYLISIPVTLFTGLSGEVAIVSTGLFVACYSTLGGVRAVVFTDVVQAVILLGGGIGTVLVVVSRLPDGFATLLADGEEARKFNLIEGGDESEFSFRDRTVWSVMATGLIAHFSSYTAGQDCVQRYLAASSLYEARKAVVLCADGPPRDYTSIVVVIHCMLPMAFMAGSPCVISNAHLMC